MPVKSGDEYATFPESSSDSEEDVLRRLRQHQQQQQQQRQLQNDGLINDQHYLHDYSSGRSSYIHHHPHLQQHPMGSVVARGSPSQMQSRSMSADGYYSGYSHPSHSIHPMAQRSFDHNTSNHLQQTVQIMSNSVGAAGPSHLHHHPLHHHHVSNPPSTTFTSQSVRPLRVAGIEDITDSSSRRRPHSKGKAIEYRILTLSNPKHFMPQPNIFLDW